MNWDDAQTYCRTHHTDLAMIEDAQENTKMMSAAQSTYKAWIGLYRILWSWSDKSSNSTFRNWEEGQPNNYGGNQYCVLENSKHQWNDDYCDREYPFVCQRDLKLKRMLRMKIQSDADLSDPASSNQMLQQLHAVLMNRTSMVDFKLVWRTEPRKQEQDDEKKVTCN
ncbi:C-type lectin lectoxin-Phi1-like [Centropristis striata]|uniref:C-type lectin lectoxin-Phi1-like n=1 Tax=Centropristis striata TaxID=184440 RepID=UPI0027E1DDBE|nr:C-type lectin lectoxin-Phi1-like [Centropristis striata]